MLARPICYLKTKGSLGGKDITITARLKVGKRSMKAVDLDYQRSAGFPSLPGCVIGDLSCVCLWAPTLDLLFTLLRWESCEVRSEAEC